MYFKIYIKCMQQYVYNKNEDSSRYKVIILIFHLKLEILTRIFMNDELYWLLPLDWLLAWNHKITIYLKYISIFAFLSLYFSYPKQLMTFSPVSRIVPHHFFKSSAMLYFIDFCFFSANFFVALYNLYKKSGICVWATQDVTVEGMARPGSS